MSPIGIWFGARSAPHGHTCGQSEYFQSGSSGPASHVGPGSDALGRRTVTPSG